MRGLWAGLGEATTRCFAGGVKVLFAELAPAVAMRHPDGPCAQFYAAFGRLRPHADFMFVMEPDATPVQDGWSVRRVAWVGLGWVGLVRVGAG